MSDCPLIKIAAGLIFSVVSSIHAAEPLVLNGDLEKADPADATQPLGWDKTDGLGVQWASYPDGPDAPHDVAAKEFSQATRQSQPKAGAAESARDSGVGLAKRLEEPALLLPCQSAPGIRYGDR